MTTKTISMPLPVQEAGGQPVKVTEKSPSFVSQSVSEAFGELFSQTDSVKCIMITVNGVLNLQFIGNGCVANMQIYEVASTPNAYEQYIPNKPVYKSIRTKRGGTV